MYAVGHSHATPSSPENVPEVRRACSGPGLSEGITDAADGAAKAAAAFENEFEDARDVAARGMHFTGQDAA